jgi:hypothetical protein
MADSNQQNAFTCGGNGFVRFRHGESVVDGSIVYFDFDRVPGFRSPLPRRMPPPGTPPPPTSMQVSRSRDGEAASASI